MKKIFLICIVTILTLSSSSATVVDPNGILDQVDTFIGKVTFDEDIGCTDMTFGVQHSCTFVCNEDGVCTPDCANFNFHEEYIECAENHVTVSNFTDERHPTSRKFTREHHSLIHANPLRDFIGLNSNYDFVIEKSQFVEHQLNGILVKSIRVDFKLSDYPISITIAQGVPWLARLLVLDLQPTPEIAPFLKLNSYSR